MNLLKLHREYEQLSWELEFEEDQCRRSKEKIRQIKGMMETISKQLNDFYDDPMTKACGL